MTEEVCPVCGVLIKEDVVYFSHGEPGSRKRLKARVCQYAKNPAGCINKNAGEPDASDYYSPPTDITINKWMEDLPL